MGGHAKSLMRHPAAGKDANAKEKTCQNITIIFDDHCIVPNQSYRIRGGNDRKGLRIF
jgi:hypothetical protein